MMAKISLKREFSTIPIESVRVDVCHIRRNHSDIEDMKRTITDVGLLQPILVKRSGDDYVVIDGARRLNALKELNVKELIINRDVIIDAEETVADSKFKQIIANIQREDINDIELGHAFVMLKEHYDYQFNEIAEIIGKKPHYVTAKASLAKRLTPEVKALVIRDWELAKCGPTTVSDDTEIVEGPYKMNVNVIERIARMPQDIQKQAYETIKEKEMDKKEAMSYLRNMKKDLKDVRQEKTEEGPEVPECGGSEGPVENNITKRYFMRINREIDQLTVEVKSTYIGQEYVRQELETLIQRLNSLYSEIEIGVEKLKVQA